MDAMDALQLAAGEFAKRLRAVTPDDWDKPTPCGEWNVRQLVEHVIGGTHMATILFRGGTRDDALAAFGRDNIGANAVEGFNGAFRTMVDVINKPGTLAKTVHHPAMDMPATQLVQFRIGDMGLHAWDLARAIGADDTLNSKLVDLMWSALEPMRGGMAQSGVFGEGPSGRVPDSAPLQTRLLDLTGRRP